MPSLQRRSLWQRLGRVLALALLLAWMTPPQQVSFARPHVSASATAAPSVAPAALLGGGRIVFFPFLARSALPTPPPPPPTQQANIEVVLRYSPARRVERDRTLQYELQVRNRGTADASGVAVTFSFDARLLLQDARLDRTRGDWVSRVEATNRVTSRVVVSFGAVRVGERRSGTLIFRVDGRTISDGDALGARATFPCSNNPGVECRSNTSQIEVGREGSGSGQNDQIRLTVEPDRGPQGTRHRFSTSRYLPGERVVTWLNVPGGVRALDATATADRDGRVAFELRSSGLAVGDYGFVTYGLSSSITGVGPFRVQGPSGLRTTAHTAASSARATAALPALQEDASVSQEPLVQGTGGIAGKVTDSAGAALGGVVVLVRDANDVLVASAVSLPSGTFFIASGLPSDVYSVEVAPSLSLGSALSGLLDSTMSNVVVVEPGLTKLAPTVLQPGGTISGVVTGQDDGSTLPDVEVLVSTATPSATLVAATVTDVSGAYTTPPLPAGSYRVEFAPQRSLDTDAQGYTATLSTDVAVTAGASSRLDAQLARLAGSGQISGRVTAQDSGAGLEGALVAISDATGSLADLALTDAAGAYASAPLPTGVYSLEVLPLFSTVQTTTLYRGQLTSPATVTLAAGLEQKNVDAALLRGGGIAGRVLGAPTSGLTQPVALGSLPVLVSDSSGEVVALAATDATGTYTATGLASGSYTVTVDPDQSSDATARGYLRALVTASVTAPAITGGVDATLQPGGRIAGRVTAKDSGAALAGVLAIVYRATDDAFVELIPTDDTGGYRSTALPPGGYKLAFVTSDSASDLSRAYLAGFSGGASDLAGAAAVSLTGTGDATADAALTRGGQIAGRAVAADSGVGLAEVQVLVYSGVTSDTLVATVLTEVDGSYSTPALPTGASYRLEFDPQRAQDTLTRSYAARFLGGATSQAPSLAVALPQAVVVSGQDIVLPLAALAGR